MWQQDPGVDDPPPSPVDGSHTNITPLMEIPTEVEEAQPQQQQQQQQRALSMEPAMMELLTMSNINDPANTRDLIMHENKLINERMTWMLVIQGFLFAGLGFVWENSGAVIYVFCATGLLTAISMQRILWAGAGAIKNMEKTFEWDSYYIELEEYKALHGNCNVRHDFTWGWEDEDEPKLGNWVTKQWNTQDRLDPKKKIRLYVLDFWRTYDLDEVEGSTQPANIEVDHASSLRIALRKEATGLIIGAIENNPFALYLYPWFFMPFVFMGAWIALVIINKKNV